jgi:Asp-tRNA(Asn)/Glu-tRNA(Gln) amidotransferase A subunit family amidase
VLIWVIASGSVREPATWHGLFGIRPTFGSSSLKGVAINSPRYDTIGMFGRSMLDLYEIVRATLDVPADDGRMPRRILYPLDFYPMQPPEYQQLTEEFVTALENALGVSRSEISLASLWAKHPPSAARGMAMQEYMDKVRTSGSGIKYGAIC